MKQNRIEPGKAGYRRLILFHILLLGCFLLGGCQKDQTRMTVETEERDKAEYANTVYVEATRKLAVYVCGEVIAPGVYEFDEGKRIEDALLAAGGFTDLACQTYINLAEKLFDGEKIYFPGREEVDSMEKKEKEAALGLVNINTAGVEEFTTLSGIGQSRAKDIIAYRTVNGPFESPEDLMKVPGIKENTFSKIKDKLVIE